MASVLPTATSTNKRSNKRLRSEKKDASATDSDGVALETTSGGPPPSQEDPRSTSVHSTTDLATPNGMIQEYVELASHIMLHPLNPIHPGAGLGIASRSCRESLNEDESLPSSNGASSIRVPRILPQSQYLVHVSALGFLKSAVRRPLVIERWSPYEIAIFEASIAEYGKDFCKIQKEIGPTKTVQEIIEFYYLWKKTTHYARWKKEYIPEHLDIHEND